MLMNGDKPLKVLLHTALARYSGYGNDGIDIADALARKGVDVYITPLTAQPPLPQSVANLLTKPLEAPFDLMITHVDPGGINIIPEHRSAVDLVVGWSMWEFSTLDNLAGKSTFKKRLKNVDALVGYSDVSTEAFRGFAPKDFPLGTLLGGFNAELWPRVERDWIFSPFRFVMNGIMNIRKNPFAVIAAFAQLKSEYPEEFEPAELHIHTRLPTLPMEIMQSVPKLWIHGETFTDAQMLTFYRIGHVLVTASRGEGKNLPALEMLSTGAPVIYTDWSGHREWGSDDYGYPLRVELRKARNSKHAECKWAEVDMQHLKETMLHCFRNRDEVRRKGLIGSQVIPRKYSWDTVIDRFFELLPDLVPGKGDEVKFKYDEALREAAKQSAPA
jgi:glycosyltransferase involved in cell wall biosynthesis